ncbi:hypothetical protein SCHPADRAFT_343943 [Schizopora paradoxa]|uniref:Uncharacterized protein n=1 Tax=Schizopora paradoxa TaxID=27342 RepID=A0A0H2RPD5_9AGAM|nr:hypothetical protein SCHPADRAFT_343943 [Schizopora paradoxa]
MSSKVERHPKEITDDQVEDLLIEVDVAIETSQKANLLGDDSTTDPALRKIQNLRNGLESAWSMLKELDIGSKIRETYRKTVAVRFVELEEELQSLTKTNARRAAKNKLGLYNSLVERSVLLSSSKAYQLKGRYENIGPALYLIASILSRVEKELKGTTSTLSSEEWNASRVDFWIALQKAAARTINSMIQFMVLSPFEIAVHNDKIDRIRP